MSATLALKGPDPFFDGASLEEQEADNYDPSAPLRFAALVRKADQRARSMTVQLVDRDAISGATQAHGEHGHFGAGGDGGAKSDAKTGTLGVGDIAPEKFRDVAKAADRWQGYGDSVQTRFAAERMLGQDHVTAPSTNEVLGADDRVMTNLANGTNAGPEWQQTATQTAVSDAYTLLGAVRDATPQELPLYRGVATYGTDPGTPALLALQPGDQFDLSLASFSNDRLMASSFGQSSSSDSPDSHDTAVLFKLAPGALGVEGPNTESEVQAPNGAWTRGHTDVITSGRFEVTGVSSSKADGRVIGIKQVGVFDPDNGGKLIKR